jgi:hypothetical protein
VKPGDEKYLFVSNFLKMNRMECVDGPSFRNQGFAVTVCGKSKVLEKAQPIERIDKRL